MTARKDPSLTGKLYAPRPVSTAEEGWRDVVGFEGAYLISNRGRLYSLLRGIFCRPIVNNRGYLKTIIRDENGRQITVLIHTLLARAFLGPCPEGKEINHKNGIKTANVVGNIEYVTHQYNVKHAYDIGLSVPRFGNATLTPQDVIRLRKEWKKLKEARYKVGRSRLNNGEMAGLSQKYAITPEQVHCIVNGKAWRHLTCA